jgi:hypothetical protein
VNTVCDSEERRQQREQQAMLTQADTDASLAVRSLVVLEGVVQNAGEGRKIWVKTANVLQEQGSCGDNSDPDRELGDIRQSLIERGS